MEITNIAVDWNMQSKGYIIYEPRLSCEEVGPSWEGIAQIMNTVVLIGLTRAFLKEQY